MAEEVAAAAAAVSIVAACNKLWEQYQSGAFSGNIRRRQFELPKRQLQMMQACKNSSSEGCEEGSVAYLLDSKLREATYELEDIVSKVVWLEEAWGEKGGIMNQLRIIFNKLILSRMEHSGIRVMMKTINETLSEIIQLQATPTSGRFVNVERGSTSFDQRRRSETMQTSPPVSDHPIIGFEEDTRKLVARLTRVGYPSGVLCVRGEGGIGKSTLAGEVYKHDEVRAHFQSFAWVSTPEQFEAKDVLEEISFSLSDGVRIDNMKQKELEEMLSRILVQKKCLVVLDKISSTETWDLLKKAFPRNDSNSKLLLTTRKRNVAQHVDRDCFLFKPSGLDRTNSMELIKACLGKYGIDLETEENMKAVVGKMLDQCSAGPQSTISPSAVIVLGQLLSGKEDILDLGEKLQNREKQCLLTGKIHELEDSSHSGLSEVFKRSYSELWSSYLKRSCFQLLASFPENAEIRVTEVCQLLMADPEFHQHGTSSEFNEDMALALIEYLEQSSLVSIVESSSTGRTKTIRLNGLVREFCVLEAKKDKFLQVIDSRNVNEAIGSSSFGKVAKHVPSSKERRLVINDVAMDANQCLILAEDTTYHCLYSFMCFKTLPAGSGGLGKLLERWTKLRILKLENQERFVKVPEWIGKLKLLTFFSLKDGNVDEVPSSIGKLRYLQTLDLRTKCAMRLPNVLWKLKRLRHLYFPHKGYNVKSGKKLLLYLPGKRNSVKSGKKLRLGGLKRLRVLVNISLEDCDLKVLVTLPKLEKLVCIRKNRGRISIPQTTSKFKCLKSLAVEISFDADVDISPILSCCRPSLIKLRLSGIRTLPEVEEFPPKLQKLTLEKAYLRDDAMVILGKLPCLKFLCLLEKVFINGTEIKCSQGDFKLLKFLRLEKQQDLKRLTVEGSLYCLKTLEIIDCKELETISDALRQIPRLKGIRIREMPLHFISDVEGEFPYLTFLA